MSLPPRPVVVQFGAGAIGRGFLGQLWTEGGYEVVFVDANPTLVSRLNERGSYPLRLLSTDTIEERHISPVRAVHADDVRAVVQELASCAFAAISVGPGLEAVGRSLIAPSLAARGKLRRKEPLNILCCENDTFAAAMLRLIVLDALNASPASHARYDKRFRCIQAVIGRMVPVPSPHPDDDPLLVSAEPYYDLPLEAKWLGPFPEVPGMRQVHRFDNYLRRKLYVHNGGHAVLAYQGHRRGHTYVWQCAEDPEVVAELRGFWEEANAYLASYGMAREELVSYENDLLVRFRNRALGDTVARVARDPARKLNAGDRLVSLASRCLYTGVAEPVYAVRAIAAALLYDPPEDLGASQIQALVREQGVGAAFLTVAQVPLEDPRGLAPRVEEAYNNLMRSE